MTDAEKVEAVKMILRDPFAGSLSPREEQVAKLTAAGYVRSEIALMLGISPGTVDDYRRFIKKKLGIESRMVGDYILRKIREAVLE